MIDLTNETIEKLTFELIKKETLAHKKLDNCITKERT